MSLNFWLITRVKNLEFGWLFGKNKRIISFHHLRGRITVKVSAETAENPT